MLMVYDTELPSRLLLLHSMTMWVLVSTKYMQDFSVSVSKLFY